MTRTQKDPVLIVAGPTASGKSALALDAAEAFAGVVINADSMQVYHDLEILTARPPAEDEARAPHRLYGVIDGAEVCSAARWLDMAVAEIATAREKGLLPVVTGGTGLYLKALMEGLSPIPEIPADVRVAARALRERIGAESFHAEVARRDPAAADRIPPSDSQRLIRAYEVFEATGRPLTAWQNECAPEPAVDARFVVITVIPERAELYARCDGRFDAMIERGALDEVRKLDARGLDPALPIMKALGVPELRRFLAGETTLEEARDLAKTATRQYAKRQCTWLRHQIRADFSLDTQYSERHRVKIFSFIRQFMLTTQP
ncbi:MAG: tRNA (adenosine(37)-N6)-dimethylallyltransferase MiaA [Rhodospirillales bacterium]|nr:tRNA (adenosine(37)-N6)-dimethylallyltransferase MiaA [Rhodospirillales bacterium]MCW8862773.1 tRNA (adenosine(37)-N6)-dimethylallyltransferase MiaA [Rhodospirillales bacterium]MCW8969875.1 tRNA (adenosine(37)-N6)-dimethylallyltransferase MiaA [Rhodospirillales bacterium]MCW9002926.1 tRNA (adenosine(37)-N6)-dimethylallyltransferase MiaA [Rhodospirillales bacterium]